MAAVRPLSAPCENLRDAVSSYDRIEGCFLELSQPDIPATLDSLVKDGATRIDVLPYFLAKGNHVERDIPNILQKVSEDHPEIQITTLSHIGAADNMVSLISNHAAQHTT